MSKLPFRISIIFLLFLLIFLASQKNTFALYKPYLKIEADRAAYQTKVAKYSPENQKKLTDLSNQIVEINNKDVALLNQQIDAQAALLDEFQRRNNFQTTPQIDKARYWLTYAHEAVAFQLIQVYIFNLTSEKTIKNDATSTVNKFESDLNSTRGKVINSLNIVKNTVK
jgi:hypothetical protein